MLTTVQRQLAALKVDLLREARDVPATYIDPLNVAISHINDAAAIIDGVCKQVEPANTGLDAQALADKRELEELRALHRAQPIEPEPEARAEPDPPFAPEPAIESPLDPGGTTEGPRNVPDLYPIADPSTAESPIKDPEAAAAEQARATGRLSQEAERQGDPPEQGWG